MGTASRADLEELYRRRHVAFYYRLPEKYRARNQGKQWVRFPSPDDSWEEIVFVRRIADPLGTAPTPLVPGAKPLNGRPEQTSYYEGQEQLDGLTSATQYWVGQTGQLVRSVQSTPSQVRRAPTRWSLTFFLSTNLLTQRNRQWATSSPSHHKRKQRH